MFRAIRAVSMVFAVLFSVNILFHVRSLGGFRALSRKRKGAAYLAALPFAIMNFIFMQDVFSTAWMSLAHLSIVLIAFDILSLAIRLFGKDTAFRKQWLKLMRRGLAFFAAAFLIAYGLINIHIVRRTEYTIRNDAARENITIGLISDTHLGNAMDVQGLEKVIDRAVSDGAELLILAGDLVDEGTGREMFDEMCRMLSEKRAPKGILFVFGNHDGSRYGGDLTREDIDQALTDAGVTVLTDESILLDGWLRAAGRRDANERDRLSPEALLADADTEREFILMADHQPAEIEAASAAGVDLLVSGHTHNGQVWPGGWLSEVLKINEIEYGHERIGDMDAVVSSGASGWGFAFRTSGRSEYVLIHVRN